MKSPDLPRGLGAVILGREPTKSQVQILPAPPFPQAQLQLRSDKFDRTAMKCDDRTRTIAQTLFSVFCTIEARSLCPCSPRIGRLNQLRLLFFVPLGL